MGHGHAHWRPASTGRRAPTICTRLISRGRTLMPMYDAIVVGARCAGSPTAMLLARAGHRVLLVDRAHFPSDTFRAHFVRAPAVRYLRSWGLLDRVLATGCPLVRKRTSDLGDFRLAGYPPGFDDVPGDLAPRRIVLDAILLEAAV